MARRGENIFKRKDGRWEARVIECRSNGKRVYRSLYGKTYTEAKAKKEEYYGINRFESTPSAKKLAAFSWLAGEWLASVRGTVKESTYTRYYRNVYSYLVPALSKYSVSRLDSTIVNQLKEELLLRGGKRGDGLSEKTVSDILSVLKMILFYAAGEGYPVMNASLIKYPRRKKKDISVIPPDIINRLEEILLSSDDAISLGILLTLHTGLRNGELCGLQWGDFSFYNKTVQINRTVERIANLEPGRKSKTKLVISEPKTDTSKREIPLPKTLCDYLKIKRRSPETYLLTGTDKPSEPHTLYVRYERFLKRNGFEGYTFHALRHSFATRGIESGFDAKSLSEILGHSDVTTIYLLRKQIPIKAWVNAVVFFEDDELESVSAFSDNVWFDRYQDLVDYISNDGKVSFGTSANDFFERCVPADYLYANSWGKSLHCIINRTTLRFKTPQGDISADNIDSIRISHHWSYDELHITMADGSIKTITLENAKIQVSDNGRISTYALCKLDYIELGRTLNR